MATRRKSIKTVDKKNFKYDICIVGGLGHVGLPLGIVFASKGLQVCLYDIDSNSADIVRQGKLPFIEYGGEPLLKEALFRQKLEVSLDITSISDARYVIIAIGTPIDEFLNPKTRAFLESISNLKNYLLAEQTIIIRSTVYPNTCQQVLKLLGDNKAWHIAYCPERIAQGYSVEELKKLPQIVAGLSEKAVQDASELFSIVSPKIIRTSMGEAELVKLFSNAWRYIQFAATNQFYMIAQDYMVDYDKVRDAMTEGYGRAATLPTAGFAAGPCLLKDTMQLVAFNSNNFSLGHSAMMVNEGLPNFIVERLRQRYDLNKTKVGILGMAFKANIDDIRDSLSFKLGKILRFRGAEVFYSDEYAKNPDFISKEELVKLSDIAIIGVPHAAYRKLSIPENVEVVDLWGITTKTDSL